MISSDKGISTVTYATDAMSGNEPPLHFLSAGELQRKLEAGDTTSVKLVSHFLDQIERHNWQGRKLNAVTATLPRELAMARATELDEERLNGVVRGPLHGIPIIIKVQFMAPIRCTTLENSNRLVARAQCCRS